MKIEKWKALITEGIGTGTTGVMGLFFLFEALY